MCVEDRIMLIVTIVELVVPAFVAIGYLFYKAMKN